MCKYQHAKLRGVVANNPGVNPVHPQTLSARKRRAGGVVLVASLHPSRPAIAFLVPHNIKHNTKQPRVHFMLMESVKYDGLIPYPPLPLSAGSLGTTDADAVPRSPAAQLTSVSVSLPPPSLML